MTEQVEIVLYRMEKPEGVWTHLDGFRTVPGSVPRTGDAIRLHGRTWRVVDTIWDFTAQPPDASVGHHVELHLEPSSE